MRFMRTSGALAATLSLLSLEAAQAQSQRPPVAALRPVQSGPVAAPRPTVIPPDLSAVQLSIEQVESLRATLAEAHTHGFALNAFSPDRAVELLMAADPASRSAG